MMNFTTTATFLATSNYADQVNSRYNKSQSHYVNIQQRIKQSLQNKTFEKQIVQESVEEFQRRNPHIKTWNDITLCKPGITTLDKIVIDTTLQRILDTMWASEIVDEFRQIAVAPISVYVDKEMSDHYICWDGQHTSVALMIIAANALGMKPEDCEVPINVYPSDSKSEMREMFIGHNGGFKKSLEAFDFWEQMVFGVRTDGNTSNEEWNEVEQKQQWIESAKMFVTARKNGDTDMPGAISRLSEVMNRKYDAEVTYWFTKYFVSLNRSNRAVQPKECWMLYDYLQLCINDPNIKLTDTYVRSVAKALRTVGANDFDAEHFYDIAKQSYQNDYRSRSPYDNLWGISYPEKRLGQTFLIAQLQKAGVKTPIYPGTIVEWKITDRDLF
jgi:hypothetical protein